MVKTNKASRSGALAVVFALSAFALLSIVSAQHSSALSGALTKVVTKPAATKTTTIRRAAPSAAEGAEQGSTGSSGRRQEWGSGLAEVEAVCDCYCRYSGGDYLCPTYTMGGQCDSLASYRIPASPNDDCAAMNGVRCSGYIDNNWLTNGGVLESCQKFVDPAH